MVAVAFKIAFHAKIHQNNIFFYFLKIIFRSAHQNNLVHTKKNLEKRVARVSKQSLKSD